MMQDQGSRTTLRNIFTQHSRVVVPLLQRDYAHGRESAKGIRDRFLNVLYEKLLLPEDDTSLPLDLDFVYGGESGSTFGGHQAFAPLDGQQRLTTLYLLHWYLALHDEKVDEFQSWACVPSEKSKKSAFSYHVRPSATDFFNTLVDKGCTLDLPNYLPGSSSQSELSELIKNQPWFYQSWERDPTIASCLVVLDGIHNLFSASRDLYQRLISEETPAITFQFLYLKKFGLNDDLYIKMNARGKPLTPFETFKASFEKSVSLLLPNDVERLGEQDVPLRFYVNHKFDTIWCDFFWLFRNEVPQHGKRVHHDDIFMNVIRAVALVSLLQQNEDLLQQKEKTVNEIREGKINTFYEFESHGCITSIFIKDLIKLLDKWSAAGISVSADQIASHDYDAATSFKRIALGEKARGADALSYTEWLQFIGWALYWLRQPTLDHLGAWMRLVSNLARNTIYNRPSEFIMAAKTLVDLVEHAGPDLLSNFIAKPPADLRGFHQHQVREEKLKASLMLQDRSEETPWTSLIARAEAHDYFQGQIEFLFAFSGVLKRWLDADGRCEWDAEEDLRLRGEFELYFNRARVVFPLGEYNISHFLFERALLCNGDYLLENKTNKGFLEDRHRDLSWKRLLRSDLKKTDLDAKRDLVRELLKRLDINDMEASLQQHIDDRTVGDTWREALIRHPALIEYCKKRQIRFTQDNEIYLLQGERRNGYYKELYTAALFETVKPHMSTGLGKFRRFEYHEVKSESEIPGVYFYQENEADGKCLVTYQGGEFRLEWISAPPSIKPLSAEAEDIDVTNVNPVPTPIEHSNTEATSVVNPEVTNIERFKTQEEVIKRLMLM